MRSTARVPIALACLLVVAACAPPDLRDASSVAAMSDEQVERLLATQPDSAATQYVEFMLSPQSGLNPPPGATPRSLLIFGLEECAGRNPSTPAEWIPGASAGPVGLENFVHTARGFAHRLICPG